VAFLRRFEQRDGMRVLLGWLEPHLDGEPLVGVVIGTDRRLFRPRGHVIAVTAERLLLVAVDKRGQPAGEPTSLTRADITRSAVWGWGDGAGTARGADEEIRFGTSTASYRFRILGGNWFENMVASESHLQGLDALVDFLLSART
jgi:hypothetical protein